MTRRARTVQAVELLVLLAVVALVVGQFLGQPILLSYVTTGSMEPTLDPGDGFVAVPAAVAGPVEEGDVVVFRAEHVGGGGLTTHRVVGETSEGFVTRGDANPSTDQAADEPPVQRPQIVAKAVQVDGAVVVVPHVGTVVEGTRGSVETVQRRLAALLGTDAVLGPRGFATLLFGLSVVAYVVDSLRESARGERRSRDRSRDTGTSTHLVVGAMTLVLVATATTAMVAPAGPFEFGVVSSSVDSPGPGVIERGSTENATYVVSNGGVVPVVVFLDPASEGVAVSPREVRLGARDRVNATVALSAPPETGYYRLFLVEHRYLAVLPHSTIASLYAVHPWLPIVAIDALLGGLFYLLGVGLLGTGRVRSRSRETSAASRRFLSRLL
ncbi:signal peptidase I [Salinigranum salinum]|uniref:signal peptidase I n=1 Tax=Salinigranum salinum TaxID=1364937 RepID=UPI0012609210|nr:signal peptidase I [Salinigranum salinum]